MRLVKYKLGELITQRREKYNQSEILPIRGVSREGFIDPKQEGADTSLYNVFYKYDFVFNPARMEVNSIALNTELEKGICSSLYEIFYVSKKDILLPEYLNMFVKRDDFARLCEFIGWGSAREYCRVNDISDIDIELPPIDVQRKYISVYNAMLANQHSYEQGLEDILLFCETQIDTIKHNSKWVPISELLEEVDQRNSDGKCTSAKGINITKQFMPSIASSADLLKYKLVNKNQFAYSGMQTGRDECIRIALYKGDDSIAISPAYSVFQCKDTNTIMPEFLMLWFTRKESDRLGWFFSDSSIRSNLDLERFYEIKIPVPEIKVQEAIVNIYNAFVQRREINERIKTLIKELNPVLIKGSIEEAMA